MSFNSEYISYSSTQFYCIQLNIQWITSYIKCYMGWPHDFNALVFLLKAVDKKLTRCIIGKKKCFYSLPDTSPIDLIDSGII